jgi:hypothetical protein
MQTIDSKIRIPPIKARAFVRGLCFSLAGILMFHQLAQAQDYSLSFNGTSDYVSCGNQAAVQIGGTAITVEAWIKPVAFGSGYWSNNIVDKTYYAGVGMQNYGYVLRCGGTGQLDFAIGNSTSGWFDSPSANSALTTGSWQHVAATYDGTNIKLYINGTLVKTTAQTHSISANTITPLAIGDADPASVGTGRFFNGNIDEVRIWSTTRTQAQIEGNMNSELAGNETGLAAYYKMSNGSGTTLTDNKSGGASTGTITGASWSSVVPLTPSLTITGGGTIVAQNVPLLIAADALVSGTGLTGASVSVSSNFVSGQDVLGINGVQSGTDGSITYSYASGTGILTLSGSAPAAEYQATIRKVTYTNTSSSPNTSARIITIGLNPALPFSGNGHYYEFITSTNISWTSANSAANLRKYFGLQGYLATITSAAENTFVYSKINASGWLGANDATTEGVWKWVCGPEAGQQFWQGKYNGGYVVGSMYNHWATGQPDDYNSVEDYLHFWNGDTWNDFPEAPADGITGYLVEYGGMAGDPVLNISANVTVNLTMTYPGNALDFDGTDDYVSIANADNLNPGTSNLTVECWFNATTTPAGEHHLYNKENLYEASIIGGYFQFALMPNWTWQGENSFPVTPGVWYHIAVVYDHINITIYKNGQLFSTLAKTADIGSNTTKLLIGARGDITPAAFFNGKIDEFRVWNTARTACEINSNMANTLVGNETGLVAYYNFDRGTAGGTNTGITTLPDLAGTDNPGTLTNMALTGSTSNWLTSNAGVGLPAVSTTGSANVTAVAADVSGNITSIGAANATIRGVCYNTAGCPTVNNAKTETSGSYGTGAFTISLSGLSGSTTYHARTYAINSSGTSYGTEITFTTLAVPANPSGITGSATTCSGSAVELTATGIVGTIYWYTVGCGGTATSPATGNTLSVSPSVTTTYYARNYNNGTFSTGCASHQVTVTAGSVGGTAKW